MARGKAGSMGIVTLLIAIEAPHVSNASTRGLYLATPESAGTDKFSGGSGRYLD